MSRPELETGTSLWPGVAAIGLFAVFAAVFLGTDLSDPVGFGENAAIMKSIGAAMFNIDPAAVTSDGAHVAGEGFIVSFILIAVVLDAALDGSLMLAKRDEEEGDN